MTKGFAFVLGFPKQPNKIRACFTETEVKRAKRNYPYSIVLWEMPSETPEIPKWYLFRFFAKKYQQIGKQDLFDIGNESYDNVKKLADEAFEKLKVDQEGWKKFFEERKQLVESKVSVDQRSMDQYQKFLEECSRDLLDTFIRCDALCYEPEQALNDIRFSLDFLIRTSIVDVSYVIGMFLISNFCKSFDGFDEVIKKVVLSIKTFKIQLHN